MTSLAHMMFIKHGFYAHSPLYILDYPLLPTSRYENSFWNQSKALSILHVRIQDSRSQFFCVCVCGGGGVSKSGNTKSFSCLNVRKA